MRTGNLNIMKEISYIYKKAFCTLFCIGMISFAGCAADTQESTVDQNTHLVKTSSPELANKVEKKVEPVPEKTIIQKTPPKKEKPRKLHKGSSYFSFAKESTESKMADFVDSPIEKVPQSFQLDQIKFAKSDSKLSRKAKKQLENVSKIIAAYYGVKLDLYVHPGTGPKTLAKKRATAIREYFIKKGLSGQRINIVGNSEMQGAEGTVEITVTSK